MGQSFVRGLVGATMPHQVSVIEHNPHNSHECEAMGVSVFQSIELASTQPDFDQFDVIVIAVKPIDVTEIAKNISEKISSDTLIVSIAAGISLSSLSEMLNDFPIVRAMPNIAASLALSATAMSCSPELSEGNEMRARQVLEALGTVIRVNEEQMNIVTAVSGSGPAYFFLLAQYLTEAAQEFGLSSEIAHQLVVQTLLGSAALADGNGSFSVLRESVTSPGGTTEAAIKKFDASHLDDIIRQGVRAAAQRAAELDSSKE